MRGKVPGILIPAAAAVIVAFAVLLLTGVWLSAPERTVDRMLHALENGRIAKAETYAAVGLGLDADNSRAKELYKAMYATMRHTVADCLREGDQVTVTVSVTMVDMEQLQASVSRELLNRSLEGEKTDQKRYYRLLARRIREGEPPMLTSTVSVALIRVDGRWKVDIENSGKFLLAITGGVGPL